MHQVRNGLARVRYQLLFGVLLSCIVPLLARIDLGYALVFSRATLVNASIASIFAVVFGFYFYHRLTRFPGVMSLSYIFPVFAISFGCAVVIFFFLRIDYSRYMLLTSFMICQIWFHFVFFFTRAIRRPRFAIVPLGDARAMDSVAGADWTLLSNADLGKVPRHGLVVDLQADMDDAWETFIADAALRGFPVYHYKQLKESLTGQVEIEHLSENTLGSLIPDGVYSVFKLIVDRVSALLLVPIVVLPFLVIAILIRLESRGPVFYRQERVGFRGRVFSVWKFRTMKHADPDTPVEREMLATFEGDPRITRVGRFLRKSRIDELPQLFNVLRGEMSWIGPRPEPAGLHGWFEEEVPFYRYRHIVRPGITGWAQVNQGYATGPEGIRLKLRYDFYYIKNFSIWLDLLIVVKTIRTILTGHGAQ